MSDVAPTTVYDAAGGAGVGRVLHDYFAWATFTTTARSPASADDVPAGLAIPRWSWDGLVDH